MCGIAGFWQPDTVMTSQQSWPEIALAMADALAMRGPDDRHAWADPSAGIGLGFRRLSIVDLSPAGRQPMASHTGRYQIVFNGEIYNHRELRSLVNDAGFAIPYRGHSDTEVLLAAIEAWGLEAALTRAVGMFAIGLWDRREQVLKLARDRMGEKPLYYAWSRGMLLFGSEIRALQVHPDFRAEIDRDSLASFMRFGYVPTPHSIYRHVYKLAPGSILTVAKPSLRFGVLPQAVSYWTAQQAVEEGARAPFRGEPHEAVDRLESLLKRTVSEQMVAEVPLGAFLSGGIDSSLIVALMQSLSSRPVKTFSIGFFDKAFNEAPHAAAVAGCLGTEHTELYVTPQEAMGVIPQIGALYDEPFADSSQIPTCLVARLARQHVTVCLSGDGGDELFGGYTRYQSAASLWKRLSWIPLPLRRLLKHAVTRTPADLLDGGLCWLRPAFDRLGRPGPISEKLHRIANVVGVRRFEDLYLRWMSAWQAPNALVLHGAERTHAIVNGTPCLGAHRTYERMLYWDLLSYLPDDILAKVDRAAMGVSLETRVPLLDHRLVEFAWRLPNRLKHQAGRNKWILREVLKRYVPNELVDRPKMGFGVPMAEWLRGPLRDWAESLLDHRRLKAAGFLDSELVRQAWHQHVSGTHTRHNELWFILMFQAWHEAQSAGTSRAQVA